MPEKKEKVVEAACARVLGRRLRALLKSAGLKELRVQCAKVSFSGFGFGDSCVAEIHMGDSKLDESVTKEVAELLYAIRYEPYDEGGGKAFVMLKGSNYAFGGSVSHKDAPTFLAQQQRDFTDEDGCPDAEY